MGRLVILRARRLSARSQSRVYWLRRTIQRLVENPISAGILQGQYRDGDTVVVDADGDRIVTRLFVPASAETRQ